jgi:hypothetical protein
VCVSAVSIWLCMQWWSGCGSVVVQLWFSCGSVVVQLWFSCGQWRDPMVVLCTWFLVVWWCLQPTHPKDTPFVVLPVFVSGLGVFGLVGCSNCDMAPVGCAHLCRCPPPGSLVGEAHTCSFLLCWWHGHSCCVWAIYVCGQLWHTLATWVLGGRHWLVGALLSVSVSCHRLLPPVLPLFVCVRPSWFRAAGVMWTCTGGGGSSIVSFALFVSADVVLFLFWLWLPHQ